MYSTLSPFSLHFQDFLLTFRSDILHFQAHKRDTKDMPPYYAAAQLAQVDVSEKGRSAEALYKLHSAAKP